jgi:hypothetical protein
VHKEKLSVMMIKNIIPTFAAKNHTTQKPAKLAGV